MVLWIISDKFASVFVPFLYVIDNVSRISVGL